MIQIQECSLHQSIARSGICFSVFHFSQSNLQNNSTPKPCPHTPSISHSDSRIFRDAQRGFLRNNRNPPFSRKGCFFSPISQKRKYSCWYGCIQRSNVNVVSPGVLETVRYILMITLIFKCLMQETCRRLR